MVSNTIPPDSNNPRLYKIQVLHHVSSLRLTYYKLDPTASLTLTDPQGKPVIPDGTTVTQTGKGTAIEVWTLIQSARRHLSGKNNFNGRDHHHHPALRRQRPA